MDTSGPSNPANNSPAAELQERLARPETVALLRDIVDRLDVVKLMVTSADGFLKRAESITDNVASSVQDLRDVGDANTIEALSGLVSSAPELMAALDKLQPALESPGFAKLVDPTTIEKLSQLVDHADVILLATQAAEEFLERGEEITDSIADGFISLRALAAGKATPFAELLEQVGRVLPGVQSLLRAVTPLLESGAIDALVSSKVLAPEIVETIGDLGDALHATRIADQDNPQSIGILGLAKTLRDPDVQRSLGFFSSFLKEFGSRLR